MNKLKLNIIQILMRIEYRYIQHNIIFEKY